MAAALLKRQNRMRKLQRDSEKRHKKQDPMKRLEMLQQRSYNNPQPLQRRPSQPQLQPQPQMQQQTQQQHVHAMHQTRQPLQTSTVLISRAAPPPVSGGGMTWLEAELPPDEEPLIIPYRCSMGRAPNSAPGNGHAGGAYGGGGAGGEVREDIVSVSDPHHHMEAPPLRSFASEAPNTKLSRSASRQGRAQAVYAQATLSAWGTPPPSAGASSGGAEVLTLPVGSAMRVARARQ